MAYSKPFLFLGLLFAFALLLSSEVISAREVAESTQEIETELTENFKGHPYRHHGHHRHHRHHEHGGYEHHHPPEKKLSEIDDDEHQDETDGFKHHRHEHHHEHHHKHHHKHEHKHGYGPPEKENEN